MNVVDINKLREIHAELMKYEKFELNDCIFVEDGKQIEVDPKLIRDFRFTGLNNRDFILSDFYKSEGFVTEGEKWKQRAILDSKLKN